MPICIVLSICANIHHVSSCFVIVLRWDMITVGYPILLKFTPLPLCRHTIADQDAVLGKLGGEAKVVRLSGHQFIMPGLIDTHIHASQFPNAGLALDLTLLDWLERWHLGWLLPRMGTGMYTLPSTHTHTPIHEGRGAGGGGCPIVYSR